MTESEEERHSTVEDVPESDAPATGTYARDLSALDTAMELRRRQGNTEG